MTCNFDPDAWFDREADALDAQRAKGELDEESYQQALDAVAERYQALVERASMPRCRKFGKQTSLTGRGLWFLFRSPEFDLVDWDPGWD